MNITLWSLLALMTLIALLMVIPPMWRRSGARGLSRKATNIQIYRERLAELEHEHAIGRLDAAQKQLQINELGRRLLDESNDEPLDESAPNETSTSDSGQPWWMSTLLILAVPALAFALYISAGSWRTPADSKDLPYLAQRLEQRLESYPQDAQAWALLGKARRALDENAAAARAFKQANELMQPPDVALLLEEVEATTLASNGDLTGRPNTLLQQVLVREPKNLEALWLAGLAARQQGDAGAAREFWNRLSQLQLPPEFAKTVQNQLSKLPSE